jgi:hypothetical protein
MTLQLVRREITNNDPAHVWSHPLPRKPPNRLISHHSNQARAVVACNLATGTPTPQKGRYDGRPRPSGATFRPPFRVADKSHVTQNLSATAAAQLGAAMDGPGGPSYVVLLQPERRRSERLHVERDETSHHTALEPIVRVVGSVSSIRVVGPIVGSCLGFA